MPPRDATQLIRDLIALETPKTWSLIVTAFGDLEGARLSGKEIGGLMALAGIKAEAVRVALHRLRQDGWIDSEKAGREVSYFLSPRAQAETRAAQQDIYRRAPKHEDGWHVLGLSAENEPPKGAIALGRALALLPRSTPPPPGAFVLQAATQPVPGWVEDRLVPERLIAQAGALAELAVIWRNVAGTMTPAQTRTARLMFVHFWRRLALRDGTWAHIALVPGGDVARAHAEVTRMLDETDRLSP